jgi:hypothetical protein
MKASERVEVEALRSLFDVPEPRGVLREAGGAIAIRVDGLPIKELNRIAGLYDLDDLEELEDVFDRGVQNAVFAARFERARELGLGQLVTETGIADEPGPSYRNMLRAGFEPTYVRPVYTLPG